MDNKAIICLNSSLIIFIHFKKLEHLIEESYMDRNIKDIYFNFWALKYLYSNQLLLIKSV
jgi:hypothetical protein